MASDEQRPAGYTHRGGGSDQFRASVADHARAEVAAFLRSPAGRTHPDAGFIARVAGPAGVQARAAVVGQQIAGDAAGG